MRSEKKQGVWIMQGRVGLYKDFGFGFEWDGNLWEGFEQRSDMICIFSKDPTRLLVCE